MFFLGITFCGGENTLNCTPTNVADVDKVVIKNGVYDDLYMSMNTDREYTSEIPTLWDSNTLMHARFQGNLTGGNVGFALNQVSSLRVKRRELGTFEWISLYDIPVRKEEDLYFERFDKYCRSGVEYEYLVVPVLNGIEGNAFTNTVLSEFNGVFILEKDRTFKTILETNIPSQKNRPSATVNTLGRKYPFVVSNGMNNYYSGSVKGVFIELDYDNCELKTKGARKYREELMEFLQNGMPKILKYEDGRIWMVSIVGTPSEATDGHHDKVVTTFDWVEIGDYNSNADLYSNNFVDIDQQGAV